MNRRARLFQVKTLREVPMFHFNPFCRVLKNRTHKVAYQGLIDTGLYAPVAGRNYVYAITQLGLEHQNEVGDASESIIYRKPHIPNNYNGDEQE